MCRLYCWKEMSSIHEMTEADQRERLYVNSYGPVGHSSHCAFARHEWCKSNPELGHDEQ